MLQKYLKNGKIISVSLLNLVESRARTVLSVGFLSSIEDLAVISNCETINL